jgi:hypothetical protein
MSRFATCSSSTSSWEASSSSIPTSSAARSCRSPAAAVCAFSVLVIRLIKGDGNLNWFRIQVGLLGLGGALYIVPYFLGVQVTQIGTDTSNQLASIFVSSENPDVALTLCYLSAALTGILAVVAVVYNFREASGRPRTSQTKEQTR